MGRARGTFAFTGPALAYAVMALSTGAALVVAVVLGVSMAIALAVLASFCILVGLWLRAQASPAVRSILARRARVGAAAGLLAVLGYDGIRLAVVALFHLRVRPLDALPHFGALLLGADAAPRAALAAGFAYHYANGMLFGTAYALVFAARPWWYGIGWGLALEAAMLALYPRWLSLEKVMAEFTVVSVIGHVTYGAVLGSLTRRARVG